MFLFSCPGSHSASLFTCLQSEHIIEARSASIAKWWYFSVVLLFRWVYTRKREIQYAFIIIWYLCPSKMLKMLHHILCDCVCGFCGMIVWLKMVCSRRVDEKYQQTFGSLFCPICLSIWADAIPAVAAAAATSNVKLTSKNNTEYFCKASRKLLTKLWHAKDKQKKIKNGSGEKERIYAHKVWLIYGRINFKNMQNWSARSKNLYWLTEELEWLLENTRREHSRVLTNSNEEHGFFFCVFAYETALIRKQNLESCLVFTFQFFHLDFSVVSFGVFGFPFASSISIHTTYDAIRNDMALHILRLLCNFFCQFFFLLVAIFRSYFSCALGTNHEIRRKSEYQFVLNTS